MSLQNKTAFLINQLKFVLILFIYIFKNASCQNGIGTQLIIYIGVFLQCNFYELPVQTFFEILPIFKDYSEPPQTRAETHFPLGNLRVNLLERFSNGCRKTKTKVITPANHNKH